MKPIFSLLHASYGRPEKAVAAMRMALERMANPVERVEFIFAINANDPRFKDYIKEIEIPEMNGVHVVIGNYTGSSPAWNAAANQSKGDVLIQMQDDLELPHHWDSALLEKLYAFHQDWDQKSAFIAVSDGYRTDALCCTAIMTRERYRQAGEFLCPQYMSVFSDDDVTYRALRDAKAEKCEFINARDLVFLHRHHYHDKSVPMDATYERENSSEAYNVGSLLFAKRNPEAATDGIRTWG